MKRAPREQKEEMAVYKSDLVETRFGFKWGPSQVSRLISDPKWGVILEVKGKRESVEIRITPGGFIRIGPIMAPVRRYDDPDI